MSTTESRAVYGRLSGKSDYQIRVEETNPDSMGVVYRLRVLRVSDSSPCKIGEIVTVKKWGTFGCWDEQNRWVNLYDTELV